MLPVVRTVLELPLIRTALPTVIGGEGLLDREVRWVHVSEQRDMTDLLQGGELVLTTGIGLENAPDRAAEYLQALEAAGAVALMLELDPQRSRTAEAIKAAAGSVRMPIITLSRRVRFVEITEIIHRMIIGEQLAKVEWAKSVHEAFTLLSLENATTEDIVRRAAEMIGMPVVLEDLSHLVLAYSTQGLSTTDLLANWERRSRSTHMLDCTARAGAEAWMQTPVGMKQQHWGRLVVPAPADYETAAVVLERASQALSINRLVERDRYELAHQARAGLLHELRQSRELDPEEAQTRAAALGLSPAPLYVPVVIRVNHPTVPRQDPLAEQQKDRSTLDAVSMALRSTVSSALAAGLQAGYVGVIMAVPAAQMEQSLLEGFSAALATHAVPAGIVRIGWTVGVGRIRRNLADAASGLDEAIHVAETASTLKNGDRPFFRSTDVRLRGMLALLRNDPRARQFMESELEGVLGSDGPGDGADLELLRKYLDSGGNKSALAKQGYLSRPALYARLAKLANRLGVDLEDPESRTSLHVAILLHDLRAL
jgi:purine catabolism regulator